jgi:AraC family transcriptional regulator
VVRWRDTVAIRALSVHTAQLLTQYVRDNLAEHITLDALACAAGLSARELFATFHAQFETTPAQYVIEQRLQRARWWLLHTRRDITAIALATGFASHSHLTTTFKKHVGVTPRQFRGGGVVVPDG